VIVFRSFIRFPPARCHKLEEEDCERLRTSKALVSMADFRDSARSLRVN
jgi:hypothetical protein